MCVYVLADLAKPPSTQSSHDIKHYVTHSVDLCKSLCKDVLVTGDYISK